MPRILILISMIACLSLVACEDDAGTNKSGDAAADTNTGDAAAGDTNIPNDTSTGADTNAGDTNAGDTGAGDTNGTDTSAGDTATADTTPPDPAAPTCTITAPLDASELDFREDWTFIAQASDPEDGTLTGASIIWNSDQVTAPLGSGETFTAQLAPGGDHVITCTAVDSDGKTGQDSITIKVLSPIAEIWHPGDGETRPAANGIPFTGRGFDIEDVNIAAGSLIWTSNLDGEFGTGEDFNSQLSAGANVVTLTVTDADGNTAATSITLTITP